MLMMSCNLHENSHEYEREIVPKRKPRLEELRDMSIKEFLDVLIIVSTIVTAYRGGYTNMRTEYFRFRHRVVPYPDWYVTDFGMMRGWTPEYINQLIHHRSPTRWIHPAVFGLKCMGLVTCTVHVAKSAKNFWSGSKVSR